MFKFLRTIDKSLEDFLVFNLKTLGNLVYNVDDHSPYTFRYGKFHRVFGHFTEKSSDSFVGREPSYCSEYVILYGSNSSASNLGSKVAHLILSESKFPLAILENYLQRPTHRVDSVGILEFKLRVSGNQRIPVRILVSLGEEQTYLTTCKLHINSDIVTSNATTELAHPLGVVEESDKSFCSVVLAFIMILGLTNLDHTEIMTLDVAGSNELDDFCTCEPTVCKDIVKMYLSGNNTLDHLYHERNLALVILLDTPCRMAVLLTFLRESGVKLLLPQVVVTLLALLADKAEIHEHLSGTVRNTEEQTFEAQNHLVFHMGEHFANHFRLYATLRIIGIVNHKAHRSQVFPLRTLLSLAPQPGCDVYEYSAPVVVLSGKKTIEHVLAAVGYAA